MSCSGVMDDNYDDIFTKRKKFPYKELGMLIHLKNACKKW